MVSVIVHDTFIYSNLLGGNSFANCIKRCIDNQYIKQYQCLPNPFIYENFILINSSQTEHRICEQIKLFSQSMKTNAKRFVSKIVMKYILKHVLTIHWF